MFPLKTPRDRYQHDNHFRMLVDMMVSHIDQCLYTPSEMREAAILASIIYEQIHIRHRVIPFMPEGVKKSLNVLHEWSDTANSMWESSCEG